MNTNDWLKNEVQTICDDYGHLAEGDRFNKWELAHRIVFAYYTYARVRGITIQPFWVVCDPVSRAILLSYTPPANYDLVILSNSGHGPN